MDQNAAKTPDAPVDSLQEQLRTLLRGHHGNLLTQIDRLGQMLSSLCAQSACDPASVVEAEGLAHQIKGAGGSIGFAEISGLATVLDDYLKDMVKLGAEVTPGQMRPCLGLFEELQRTAAQTTPESSTLYNADLSRS
jgi:HPt (histidine-containing phosphotransfer) domain-containing protein